MADAPRLLAVVAHPDDETFGFGSILAWAAAARAAELREAADRLGVSRVDLLDFADSGMVGNAVPGTLVAAPFEDVVAAVLAEVDAVRPSVVLTLDAATGTGTTRARALRHPVGRSQSGRAGRARLALLPAPFGAIGAPDEEVTTVLETSARLATRWAAIRAHRSQVSPYEDLPPDLQEDFLATERLHRVVPPWTGGPPEDSLLPT